ncbi:hypothetical protein AVEN_198605-1 [Araneus ventricosus]|uniref:Uncharacterized protein n=1 Tax=Araneus ventricosus TaxID=182803 RepID=A0A4Y2R9W1_ARAVE|nr:hypothetical protein AVEN_263438-1 [Araneus ventricosus]GBN72059.1 hypothetical protein AVEN_39141-1 [Araneus ventricosus]GBN72078.1 hypothetical protein AVEN_116273-1 [Araneus ventricosus]GBN72096.1 hypothetical protein AVEN_198605-1 [Araneus ventricosus]
MACGLANLESLEVRTCGLWSVEFRLDALSNGKELIAFKWLGKSLGSARVNGCTDAVWPLPSPLTCDLFTGLMRETTDALTSPRTSSILPVPSMGK